MRGICLLSVSVQAARSPPTTFQDFFDGKWELEIRPLKDQSVNGSVTNAVYDMKKMGDRMTGIYYENSTTLDEDGLVVSYKIKNKMRVRVEIDGDRQGVFRTAPALTDIFTEDESDEPSLKFKTLFEFDFHPYKSGIWVSTGEWHGNTQKSGKYQFLILSTQSFHLTVTLPEGAEPGGGGGHTMAGFKPIQHSFWDQFGVASGIFIILIGSKVMRQLASVQANRRKAAQQSAAARQQAAAAKKSK